MCHTGSIVFPLSEVSVCMCVHGRKRERERRDKTDGMVGKEEGYYQTYWTHQLIKLFEIATEGTRMPLSQGKRLMSLCLAAGELKKKSKEWNKRRRAGRSMCACVLCGAAGEKKKKKKRLSMPCSMGSRWEDAEMWDGKKKKKKLLIIEGVQ